jgi:hypothetical protein
MTGHEWTFEETGSVENNDDEIHMTMKWCGMTMHINPDEYWDFEIEKADNEDSICGPFRWNDKSITVCTKDFDIIQIEVPFSPSFTDVIFQWHESAEITKQKLEDRKGQNKEEC